MEIFRAMSDNESQKTIFSKIPVFDKRFKWFSSDFGFIQNRVMDGRFNNSEFKKGRYVKILSFTINQHDLKFFSKVGNKELMLDLRKVHLIKWPKIKEMN